MDKQKIDKLVNKIKKAQKLMEEVHAEINICNRVEYWYIFDEKDFKEVCEALGIKYYEYNYGSSTHAKAIYNGLEIICVF